MKKIALIGSSDFAIANAYFLQTRLNDVTLFLGCEEKAEELISGRHQFTDRTLQKVFKEASAVTFSSSDTPEFENFDILVFCEDYDFQAQAVPNLLELLEAAKEKNPALLTIIRSNLPLGFCFENFGADSLVAYYPRHERNGSLFDDMYKVTSPIIGAQGHIVKHLAAAYELEVEHFLNHTEAEAAHIFRVAHLAMRKNFFNEVEEICAKQLIDAPRVIEAICRDSRIGSASSNTSFGLSYEVLPFARYLSGNSNTPTLSSLLESDMVRHGKIAERILSSGKTHLVVYGLGDTVQDHEEGSTASVLQTLFRLEGSKKLKIEIFEPKLALIPAWLQERASVIESVEIENLDVTNTVILAEKQDLMTDYYKLSSFTVISVDFKVE